MAAVRVDKYDRIRCGLYAVGAAGMLLAAGLITAPKLRLATGLHWWWAPLGATGAAVMNYLYGRRQGAVPAGAHRAAAWLAGGGWVGWCWEHHGPLGHPNAVVAWVVGAALAAGAGAVEPMPDDQPIPGPGGHTPPPGVRRDQVDAGWEARLANVGKAPGAVVTAIEPWPADGYTVHADLPVAASPKDEQRTWADLAGRADKLYASLRLPAGAGVEVGPGAHSLSVRIDVATRDTLSESVEYTDTRPLTINGPLPLGTQRDTLPVAPVMRSECSLILAAPNKGKTNYLHTLTAGYVRCPDALVWHIDLAGGGLALPWLDPWLEGHMGRPVIDWVATSIPEARLMTEVALAVIMQRRAAYRRLMAEHNTDIVPCSADIPAIRIISDETAEATGTSGDKTLRDNLVRIIQMGRAVGVRVDLSILRATETVIPMDALKLINTRVAFGVTDQSEFAYAMGWTARFDPQEAPHQGMGWWRPDTATGLRVFRTPHTARPQTIERIARACEHLRPELDRAVLTALRDTPAVRRLYDGYMSRWERLVPVLTGAADLAHTAVLTAPAGGARAVAQSGGGEPGDWAAQSARFDAAVERARAEQRRAARWGAAIPDEFVARELERLEDAAAAGELVGDEPTRPAGEHPRGDARDRLLRLLEDAGPAGTSGHKLAQAMEGLASRDTVYRWLREDAVDGGRGTYIHPKYRRA